MSLDRKVRFDGSELLNEKADNLHWQIIAIDEVIKNFIEIKKKEKEALLQDLVKIQDLCERSEEGHTLVLFENGISEIDRDIYRCQKCGKITT